MGRLGFSRGVRRLMPVFVLVAVLGLLAGVLPSLVASPGGSGGGLAVQAPGSNGSLHSLPWWDPRGWFGGGNGAPSSKVLDGNVAAVPRAGRLPHQAKAAPAHRVREIVSKRSEYSRTYLLSDGQQQQIISAGPVDYRDAKGGWEPISTAVGPSSAAGYRYQNTTNVFRSFFGATAGRLVRFDAPGGGWVTIGLAAGTVGSPQVSGDTVTYRGIAPGVTLSYQVTPRQLTERVSLASASAGASLASLPFVVTAGGGLRLSKQAGGSVAVTRRGMPVLMLPKPFMTDSRRETSSPLGHAWSPKVTQHETFGAAGDWVRLSVSADAGWLGQRGRVFPVVVDPSIAIVPGPADAQNTSIYASAPSANFSGSWELPAGTDSAGAWRSLLSFPVTGTTLPADAQLESADLRLFENLPFGPQAASPVIEADQATAPWQASTATWANASNNVGQQGFNQVTVDDSDAEWASASGAWPAQADANAVNGGYVYDQDTTAGDAFTWVPQLTEAGDYQVQAHYVADSAAAKKAPYTVNYDGGSQQFTVDQTSGSGGQWATLGTLPFAAGTAGSVVLGDGPASASTRVEADAVRLTKPATVVFNPSAGSPSTANTWDTFSVGNIVQSWLDGSSPNDGFVVKASDETKLNVGGPVYQASGNYFNESATYPQLVLTWGLPGVSLNPVTTVHSTGAELSWAPYANATFDQGKNLAGYQVYRSLSPAFTPGADTLIGTVASTATSFTDTTATPTPPGASTPDTVYYMVAARTTDGTVIAGMPQAVQLPVAGNTTQVIDASGSATLSSALPDTSVQFSNGVVSVGNDNFDGLGVFRTLLDFPSMASAGVPADATITGADLKMWGYWNDASAGGFYVVPSVSQANDPATATWNDASAGTPWTTPGGSLAPGLPDGVLGLSSQPFDADWPDDASFLQGWVTSPASENGLIIKLNDESSVGPQESEWFWGATATEPALRPQLVVTYTEPTPADTYYVPQLPDPMITTDNYTVPVTLTNTTSSAWTAADWTLAYHWLLPDGTNVSAADDLIETPLPADLAPGASVTVNASVTAAETAGSGDDRNGYQLAWDMYDKTTGTWLSSGTSTPAVTATMNQPESIENTQSNMLGLEQYYQYTGVNTGSGTSLLNNDDNGNVVWNYNAFSNPSRGFRTFVRLDYNSMDTTESSMGFGWSLQASTLQRLGTPLDFDPRPNPTSVTLTDGDGTTHTFTWNAATSTWVSPPGLHYFLQQQATCTPNGKDLLAKAWLLTAPDRTQFWFDCQGYQSAVIDKNGNEADFTYTQRNSSNSPREFLDSITDPAGRQTLSISYYHKGDNYQYVDDSTGNLVSDTNLTDPDIIDMIKSVTAVNGRTISFFYDKQGLMSLMTDGDGSSATKTFKFAYDMTQGNKNVKLVAVTDPRGNTANLTYFTAPQDPKFKWSLETIADRLQRTTSFAYTEPSGGGIQTVVTDPKTNTTTYLMDTQGRPVQSVNAKNQVTNLAWDTDNNVTSLTEDAGGPQQATSTWTYDPNTGYPLTTHDAQANADGTAGTTFTYNFSDGGHVADLASELTPKQRLTTFTYDTNGNLKTATQPLGNVSGAATGSYTTTDTYDSFGDLTSTTDPDGNTTAYSDFDATGQPRQVTDPVCYAQQQAGTQATCHPTSYTYDATGNQLSVTDAMGLGTSTYSYDVFGRPLASTVPETATTTITTPAPVYDGNDNVTQSTAPNGAATTSVFDADDELKSTVTPPDTSGGTAPETTYTYDADGNLKTATQPLGNVSGATPGSYTTTYGYDTINERTTVTDALGNVTHYGYDDVGNQNSVATPSQFAAGVATTTLFNDDHQPVKVTDPAGNVTQTGYDLDGLVDSTTDQNGNQTLLTLDADRQLTQQEVPAQAPGAAVSYDVTQYVYDQAGQQTQVISPRGSADGVNAATSACVATATCPYTTVTKYTADRQVQSVQAPYLPGDPNYGTAAETDYTYDGDGNMTQVSAPPAGSSATRQVTGFSYLDDGLTAAQTDPTGIKTSYGYNPLGEQTSRTVTSADGDLSRTMGWAYYPDGKLQSVSDNGIPTGMQAEVTQASDPGVQVTGTWTKTACGTTAGCEGTQYDTHAAGTGSDSFSWHLYVPQDGNYTVYVKYPVVSGAATNAQYTVSYNGGTATATVDQTQNNNNGWVSLGKHAFTQDGTGQQVSLAENSGGTVVADAVKIVRDNTGETNTALHGYSYTYDPDGQQTGIADTSSGAAITNYVTAYDQDGNTKSVTEKNAAGTAVHTTTFAYDTDNNEKSMTHDGASSSYQYNLLEQLSTETDPPAAAGTGSQVSTFTYTPTGQVLNAAKPNGNTVANTYYANGQPYTVDEATGGSTTVSDHQYTYDPDGNTSQDVKQLMSADNSSTYLNHTLGYTYSPQDQVSSVTTDGTMTESYTHDAGNDVTAQTVNGTTTSYGYNSAGQMVTATAGGTTADYNYDPFGRLDTVTSGGQTLQSSTYDGFDNLSSISQLTPAGTMATTSYAYDSLGRTTSQTTSAGTTSLSYLGATGEVASETDPGGTSKAYDYTPAGARLSQTTTSAAGTVTPGYYSYDAHSDVEALTSAGGTTMDTYGYTAYGSPIASMFTGNDQNNATPSPTSTTTPDSSYRFNAMRWDGTSGQYDMGFRTYDPAVNQFTSRDMYSGALANAGLTTDPFTGGAYAYGSGNPISNIELNGHRADPPIVAPCPPPYTATGCLINNSPSRFFTLLPGTPTTTTPAPATPNPVQGPPATPPASAPGGSSMPTPDVPQVPTGPGAGGGHLDQILHDLNVAAQFAGRALLASTFLARPSDYALLCGSTVSGGIKILGKEIGVGGIPCIAETKGGKFYAGAGISVGTSGLGFSLVGGHIATQRGILDTPSETDIEKFVSGLGASLSINVEGEAVSVVWGNAPDTSSPILGEEVGVGTPGFGVSVGDFGAISSSAASADLGAMFGDSAVGLFLLKTALFTAIIECRKHLKGGAVVVVVVPAGMNPETYCQPTAGGPARSRYHGRTVA